MLVVYVIEPTQKNERGQSCFYLIKDVTLWCDVEYQWTNVVITWNSYPIPCMDKCIDFFGDVTILLTKDTNKSLWQEIVADKDRNNTEFASHRKLFPLNEMPCQPNIGPERSHTRWISYWSQLNGSSPCVSRWHHHVSQTPSRAHLPGATSPNAIERCRGSTEND